MNTICGSVDDNSYIFAGFISEGDFSLRLARNFDTILIIAGYFHLRANDPALSQKALKREDPGNDNLEPIIVKRIGCAFAGVQNPPGPFSGDPSNPIVGIISINLYFSF